MIETRGSDGELEAPPIDDPYDAPPIPPQRAELSMLALTAVLAPLLGPLGAIVAIVFGWAARSEIAREPGARRGSALATVGLVLGVVFTIAWGSGLGYFLWTYRYTPEVVARTHPDHPPPAAPPADDEDDAPAAPPPIPAATAPKSTTLANVGGIQVVDVGAAAPSLSEELARQRAEASKTGSTVLVMTTRDKCEPCRGVDKALADPLMQTALAQVRLIRVDVEVFHEELNTIKVPHTKIPGFFLLSLDLTPKDGINGGEWDDDVAPNIAPVLSAFVRGKYGSRRETWQPLPGSGMRL